MQQFAIQLYTLGTPSPPFGDYGDILIHGLVEIAADGTTLLMRTGPFVPPITQPAFAVIVTDSVRAAMEVQQFTGFTFVPATKRRIVHHDWQGWDPCAGEPAEFPESGEPENYVMQGVHDPKSASEMEELWELRLPPIPGFQISGSSDFDAAKYSGQDICKMQRLGGYVYVSQRLRDWFTANYPEWVTFTPARPTAAA
ncbi:MAG: hypothetical protein JWM57_3873 [Phycisphaerales bacterium]|nr:hypothetical protein [Phycisphaerales bacterium]